jgi:dUTP pyrophosphatase
MTRVRIRRLTPSAAIPRYETAGAAGFDLSASQDMTVQPGEVTLVPTGLAIEVPPNTFLGVFARSSTPLTRGLMVANGVGVVDPDYCGPEDEVKIEVYNFTARPVHIRSGDRIAQGILIPTIRVEWDEAAELKRESRGGFGATGATSAE